MLPPGPRTPRIWQTFRFMLSPYSYSKKIVDKYGPVVRVAPLNGRGVAVASPEGAKIVFAADPDTFDTPSALGDLFGVHSLLATAGAKHRRQRKLLNPRFHGQRVKSFLEV